MLQLSNLFKLMTFSVVSFHA